LLIRALIYRIATDRLSGADREAEEYATVAELALGLAEAG
jgi:hypothetical protein